MSQTLEMEGQKKEVFRQICGLVGWKAEAECDLDSQRQTGPAVKQPSVSAVLRAQLVSGRKDGGWAVGKLLWDTQDRKDEGGQVRTAKLHWGSGNCSDRIGRHWQDDGDRTF